LAAFQVILISEIVGKILTNMNIFKISIVKISQAMGGPM